MFNLENIVEDIIEEIFGSEKIINSYHYETNNKYLDKSIDIDTELDVKNKHLHICLHI